MSQDEFTKLFKYMQGEFKKVNDRLDQTATKTALNTYVNAVDAFAKRTEIYYQEMLVLNHQVERHDHWINEIAQASDVKLSA